ncbi:MAG: restriction endonuclease subunit S [Phyllobacteriaceae bacterium]|nr:restriction endonuclease subunit S [Phyllobacteriaceae bacterium]MBA92119.1 restriction endonuclease subunit S [Phyllobacteriaceae bacterium]
MGVIRGTDFDRVRQGDLSSVPVRYIPEKAAHRKVLQSGDILIETAGGTKDQPTGRTVYLKAGIIESSPRPLICASFSRFLRPCKNKIDTEFLFWFLQYLWKERLIYHYHIQHTGVARFQYTLFASEQEIPDFSLRQQREIAAILGVLDDKIELNRKTAVTLEAMARALYRSWFVDFDPVHAKAEGRAPAHMDAATAALFPDRFGDDGLPEGWEETTIGSVAEIVGGATPKTSEASFWDGGEHLWATPKDLSVLSQPVLFETSRKITDAGLGKISSGLSPIGSVLLSSRAPIGYLAIAKAPVAVNQGFIVIRESKSVSAIEAYFWCIENMDLIVANANGSTFQEISKKNFRPLPYVLASQSVRAAFRQCADGLFERLTIAYAENRTLAALRDALLPRLMSGELRVGEAREQVEAVA